MGLTGKRKAWKPKWEAARGSAPEKSSKTELGTNRSRGFDLAVGLRLMLLNEWGVYADGFWALERTLTPDEFWEREPETSDEPRKHPAQIRFPADWRVCWRDGRLVELSRVLKHKGWNGEVVE